ncbi:MAG TPA: vitamin K epoxide reductase family protein [Nocardioides sp.]|uniref:vitamin K epoxide reductase family protein n=1 Tax=Nocardioides sp. TaxID=35761 RepID=UPI002C636D8D|nr:vitamin K epoxide reductase family protein [Nocardioides sp.]HQR28374.1 vitamin K epoxide reductase family protein [Nocardioides sp.]
MTATHPSTAPQQHGSTAGARSGDLWAVVLGAALAGLGFTVVQIMEKITILKDPGATLSCDLSTTVSCTDVLNAWQSSVLGPPNALIGAVMFALLGSAALAGFLGSELSRSYLATMWGLAVFFLSFATWFMYETAFSIGRLCPWCIGITTAVVVICAALTRLADRHDAFGDTGFGRRVSGAVRSRLDLVVWAVWWVVIAGFLLVGLAF